MRETHEMKELKQAIIATAHRLGGREKEADIWREIEHEYDVDRLTEISRDLREEENSFLLMRNRFQPHSDGDRWFPEDILQHRVPLGYTNGVNSLHDCQYICHKLNTQ